MCPNNLRPLRGMKTLKIVLVLILAMTIPSFSLGAKPQEKQGTGLSKQQAAQSLQQFKDQKKKEFERFVQKLMDSKKRNFRNLKTSTKLQSLKSGRI